jgi:hypothetical protein
VLALFAYYKLAHPTPQAKPAPLPASYATTSTTYIEPVKRQTTTKVTKDNIQVFSKGVSSTTLDTTYLKDAETTFCAKGAKPDETSSSTVRIDCTGRRDDAVFVMGRFDTKVAHEKVEVYLTDFLVKNVILIMKAPQVACITDASFDIPTTTLVTCTFSSTSTKATDKKIGMSVLYFNTDKPVTNFLMINPSVPATVFKNMLEKKSVMDYVPLFFIERAYAQTDGGSDSSGGFWSAVVSFFSNLASAIGGAFGGGSGGVGGVAATGFTLQAQTGAVKDNGSVSGFVQTVDSASDVPAGMIKTGFNTYCCNAFGDAVSPRMTFAGSGVTFSGSANGGVGGGSGGGAASCPVGDTPVSVPYQKACLYETGSGDSVGGYYVYVAANQSCPYTGDILVWGKVIDKTCYYAASVDFGDGPSIVSYSPGVNGYVGESCPATSYWTKYLGGYPNGNYSGPLYSQTPNLADHCQRTCGDGSTILSDQGGVCPNISGACGVTHNSCTQGVLGNTAEYPTAAVPNLYAWQWWCNGSGGGKDILCNENKTSVAGPLAGSMILSAPSCVIDVGSGSCSVNLSWNTVNAIATSIILRSNPAVTAFTANQGGPTPIIVNGPPGALSLDLLLSNGGHPLDRKSVAASCYSGGWDSVGKVCADPNGSSYVTGSYYTNPGTLHFTCTLANGYKIMKDGVVVSSIIDGSYVSGTPTTYSLTSSAVYQVECFHGDYGHLLSKHNYYTPPAPSPILDLNLQGGGTVSVGSLVTLSWDIIHPKNTCMITAHAVCSASGCSPQSLSSESTVNAVINASTTDFNDPNGSRPITAALTTIVLGHEDSDWKALGKKTFRVTSSTDFTLSCGTGNTLNKRVWVTSKGEL